MKSSSVICLAFLVGVLLFGSACVVALVDNPEFGVDPRVRVYNQTVDFPPGGILTLKNFDGDIEISGWDSDEMEVYAEKIIYPPMRPRLQVLSWNRAEPRIDLDKSDDRIRIVTRSPDKEGKDCIVDYYINVPQSVRLRNIIAREGNVAILDLYGEVGIELKRGDVHIENFSGSVVSSVDEGSISAALLDLREEDEIKITTKNGDIVIFLQPEVNAHMDISSPNGQIFSELDIHIPDEARTVSAKLGDEEGASIFLEALNGDIQIKKAR
jgi:hypothetical protein